jgi:trigger factor
MAKTQSKPQSVTAEVAELPGSRVKVEAQVSPQEVCARLDQAAAKMGRDLRMPGFRKGKVPAAVVIQRIGRDAVLDEAVRGSIGRWYVGAVESAGLATVGDPEKLDIGDLPDAEQPLSFSFEIGIRPTAKLGKYKGLEVAKREPAAEDEAVDAEIEQLRERMASLEAVDRAAATGDFVVVDYLGTVDSVPFEGGEGRDQLIELGSGRLIPGFEEQLTGAKAGDDVTVKLTFPDDYPATELAGKDAQFAVTVKEVKAKQLPELDDDFASDAAGFDSLQELRDDLATRLRESDAERAEGEFREAVLDAVVADAKVEVPEDLVKARAQELWERMQTSLARQGIPKDQYLMIAQKTEEELIAEAIPDAEQALRRESVIAAVIEAESIRPGDGDLLDALQEVATRDGSTPEKLRKQLEKAGQLSELREDLAQRQAIDLIVESAKPTAASPDNG